MKNENPDEIRVIKLSKLGIEPSSENCCADAHEKAINSCGDNCKVIIPDGIWFIRRRIAVRNHKNFTLSGGSSSTTIRVHFCNTDLTGLDGAFMFEDCENLKVCSLNVDCDVPPNMAGEVTGTDTDSGTFDVRFYDEFRITGNEMMPALNSVDDEYTPDYCAATYKPVACRYLGNNVFRFNDKGISEKLHVGHKINVRSVIYGPVLFSYRNVRGCVNENINVYAAPGAVYLIQPRCSDFEFLNCNVVLPENSSRIYSANADGIHIRGLMGSLHIKNCRFENLGDDALNIHSTAGIVEECSPDGRSLKLKGGMEYNWASEGDIINLYDPRSFALEGKIRVLKFSFPELEYELLEGSAEPGLSPPTLYIMHRFILTDLTLKIPVRERFFSRLKTYLQRTAAYMEWPEAQ